MADRLVHYFRRLELATPTVKHAVLREAVDDLDVRRALTYALDPYKTYGVKQWEALTVSLTQPQTTWDEFFTLLDRLAARELTGNHAKMAVSTALSLAGDRLPLMEAILFKDLRCGVQAKTVNKAIPGLIPEFRVQLAADLSEKHVIFPAWAEVKYDGKRIIAELDPDSPTVLRSRNGIEEKGYQHIRDQLDLVARSIIQPMVMDGELMFGMFGHRKEIEHEADYIAFDLMTKVEWDRQVCHRHMTLRRSLLDSWLVNAPTLENVRLSEGRWVYNRKELEDFYQEVLAAGGEGLIIKHPNVGYDFKRSRNWMKYKPTFNEDLVVTGVYEGEGKYEDALGGVVVDFKGVKVRVGSGFTDGQRTGWWPEEGLLIGETVEVEHKGITPDGSLRHPVFVRVRDDK